jgi:deoxyribonuclease-4
MKRVGPHVHTTGGVFNAPLNAAAVGATAFGLFTKNQRRWDAKPLDNQTIDAFRKNLSDSGFLPKHVLAHNSYLINIGHPDKDLRTRSLNALIDELNRCNLLGLPLLNIHPGSHLNLCTVDECLEIIAASINIALDKTEGVTVVLENTSGQGSNVGFIFEHIAEIIRMVHDKSRIGFCLDTCHTFSAGYDLRTKDAYEKTMNEVDRIIGFRFLRGAHLNDSKAALGSRLDRHHSIGKGDLGTDAFRFIMNDPRFEELPLVLETIDESLWAGEIAMLYEMVSPSSEP